MKDEHGAALAFFQPQESKDPYRSYGDYVAVVLPQATTQGQEETLTFEYAGKHMILKVGTGNYFCPSYGWYPGTTDDFATRADFEMTFHTPKRLMLVATGDKTGESTDGNWTHHKVEKSDAAIRRGFRLWRLQSLRGQGGEYRCGGLRESEP